MQRIFSLLFSLFVLLIAILSANPVMAQDENMTVVELDLDTRQFSSALPFDEPFYISVKSKGTIVDECSLAIKRIRINDIFKDADSKSTVEETTYVATNYGGKIMIAITIPLKPSAYYNISLNTTIKIVGEKKNELLAEFFKSLNNDQEYQKAYTEMFTADLFTSSKLTTISKLMNNKLELFYQKRFGSGNKIVLTTPNGLEGMALEKTIESRSEWSQNNNQFNNHFKTLFINKVNRQNLNTELLVSYDKLIKNKEKTEKFDYELSPNEFNTELDKFISIINNANDISDIKSDYSKTYNSFRVLAELITGNPVSSNKEEIITALIFKQEIPIISSTESGSKTKGVGFHFAPTVGYLVAPRINQFATFVGINVYFRPLNPRVPLRYYRYSFGSWAAAHFCIQAGVTLATWDKSTDNGKKIRDGYLGGAGILLGGAFRPNRFIHIGAGAILYKAYNPSPLINSQSQVALTPYISISIDTDIVGEIRRLISQGRDAAK